MKKLMTVTLTLLLFLIPIGCGPSEQPASDDASDDRISTEALPTLGEMEDRIKTGEKNDSEKLSVLISEHRFAESSSYGTESSVTWNSVLLDQSSAEEFPRLERALSMLNNEKDCVANEEFPALVKFAEDYAPVPDCFLDMRLNVQRADRKLFSILSVVQSYQGGAHPNSRYDGVNFDTETGKRLALSDVISDLKSVPEILEEDLIRNYPDITFYELQNELKNLAEAGNLSWVMGQDGITFYFSPYMIASYADGLLTSTIWFEEHPELFSGKYLPEQKEYILPLIPGETLCFDRFTEDGQKDTIYVNTVPEEDAGCCHLEIALNDTRTQDMGFVIYSMHPYLVHLNRSGVEKNYLYLDCTSENDYQTIYIYDLNGEKPFVSEQLNGSGFCRGYHESAGAWYELFNRTENFILDTRIDLLSTMTGYRTYSVNDSGIPEAETEDYTLDNDIVLATKCAVSAIKLSDKTEEVLPKGTKLTFLRTDNESYVDMAGKDETEYRIKIDTSEESWMPLIQGIPAADCFDGMIFAG